VISYVLYFYGDEEGGIIRRERLRGLRGGEKPT
jgi:hypothetical protein